MSKAWKSSNIQILAHEVRASLLSIVSLCVHTLESLFEALAEPQLGLDPLLRLGMLG